MSAVCLGRCDLPKHHCLKRDEVKPGPVPKHMGWLYTAQDAPEHQLRCGWRPGHISTTVLRKIAAHNGKCGNCTATCLGTCNKPCNLKPCAIPPKCSAQAQQTKIKQENEGHQPRPPPPVATIKSESNKAGKADPNRADPSRADPSQTDPSKADPRKSYPCKSYPCKFESCRFEPCCTQEASTPFLRVIRHAGKYSIVTDPPDNSPSGPYPLKYVLNCDPNDKDDGVKFSLEAKYNDYCFDYTSSQTSFVLDFSPPDRRCCKPYQKDPCAPCTPGCLLPC